MFREYGPSGQPRLTTHAPVFEEQHKGGAAGGSRTLPAVAPLAGRSGANTSVPQSGQRALPGTVWGRHGGLERRVGESAIEHLRDDPQRKVAWAQDELAALGATYRRLTTTRMGEKKVGDSSTTCSVPITPIAGTILPIFPLDSISIRFQIMRLFPGCRTHFPGYQESDHASMSRSSVSQRSPGA